jgi:hypothetical protein
MKRGVNMKAFVSSAILIFILFLTGCEPSTERIVITQYPERIVYFSGIDTELDLTGGEITFHMSDRTTKTQEMRRFLSTRIRHDIDFNTPGVYIVEITNYNGYGAKFPIQVVEANHTVIFLNGAEPRNDIPKDKIKLDFEKEMSSWSGNTGEGVDILIRYGDIWKDEMENYYKLVYDSLLPEKRHWLESSQNQWEIFTKENEELKWQTYEQMFSGGTIMRIFEAHIYYQRYEARALQLRILYGILNPINH